MAIHRTEKKILNLSISFLQHIKVTSIIFYVYLNIELTKILHLHSYIVSNTEKFHHHQLCRHIIKCVYATFVDSTRSVHADSKNQVYILVSIFLFCLL